MGRGVEDSAHSLTGEMQLPLGEVQKLWEECVVVLVEEVERRRRGEHTRATEMTMATRVETHSRAPPASVGALEDGAVPSRAGVRCGGGSPGSTEGQSRPSCEVWSR